MKTYPKINTIWKRDENGALQDGELSDEAVACVSKWVASEKIDGTNIRVVLECLESPPWFVSGPRFWISDKKTFYDFPDGKRTLYKTIMGRTDNASIPPLLKWALDVPMSVEKLANAFDYLATGDKVILFGEGYGPKIQGGGKYSKDYGFILFDVWFSTSRGELWAERSAVASIADSIGVPSVATYDLGDTPDEILRTMQNCVNDGLMIYSDLSLSNNICNTNVEGFVCRPTRVLLRQNGDPLMWKIKFRDLKKQTLP